MLNFINYHQILINRALNKALSDFGYNKPLNAVRALAGWAFGAYFIHEWDSKMFSEEIPFWLAALSSIGAIVVLTFLYEWSRQGHSLFIEINNDKSTLEENINKIKKQEDIILGACELHRQGKQIYNEGFSDEAAYHEWLAKMEDWSNKVKSYFLEKTNASLVHSLDNTYNSTWFDFNGDLSLFNGAQKKAEKFSGMIMVVDDFIKGNATEWRNDIGR